MKLLQCGCMSWVLPSSKNAGHIHDNSQHSLYRMQPARCSQPYQTSPEPTGTCPDPFWRCRNPSVAISRWQHLRWRKRRHPGNSACLPDRPAKSETRGIRCHLNSERSAVPLAFFLCQKKRVILHEPPHCVDAINPSVTNFSWLILSAKLRINDLYIANLCGALSGRQKYSIRAFVSWCHSFRSQKSSKDRKRACDSAGASSRCSARNSGILSACMAGRYRESLS